MKPSVLAVALLLVWSLAFASAPAIEEAEKAACEIVADHLARGPVAVVERLSAKSPFAGLSRRDALDEMAARLGPAEGVLWELRTTSDEVARHGAVFHVLFPSGTEDMVAFDMVEENGAWKIYGIRTLIDVSPEDRARAHKAPAVSAPADAAPAPKARNILWLLFAAPLLTIAGAVTRRRYSRTSSFVLSAALVVFAVPVAEIIDPDWVSHLGELAKPAEKNGEQPAAATYFAEARLVAARRSAAIGTAPPPVTGSPDASLREAALLWRVQLDMGRVPPEELRRMLSSLQSLSNAPLASLLRARLAADDGRRADAAKEYASMRTAFVPHDTFDSEEDAVQDRSKQTTVVIASRPARSRDAGFYYLWSMQQVIVGNLEGARQTFREAWRLQPMSRRDVITTALFAFLLRDPSFAILLNVNTPDEQKFADMSLSRSPMRVPAGAQALASGAFVRIAIGKSLLDLPGGAAIAPAGTKAVSATDLEREAAEAAIRRASGFSAHNFSSVSAQRTVEDAVEALAEHNRWDQILALTDGITAKTDNLPASLLTWRVRALLRAHRLDEARGVATGIGMATALQRSPDPGTLIETSELLAQSEAWTDAAEALQKVGTMKDAPDVGLLLRRLELRRQLAASPPVVTTTHFAIHATGDVPVTVSQRIGELLEAELLRVSTRLQTGYFSPVRVNVLRWKDFRGQLTLSDHILGFYDGEITIPFGDVSQFRDSVVAVLTHEMTHAVVAQATGDKAPRWFQEGLAQRMELIERQRNIFEEHRDQQFVPLDLVDASMQSIDPQAIGNAYIIAETFIRFLEDRYGPQSMQRVMAQFRDGSDTAEALAALTGKSLPDLDREFRMWGLTHTATFVDTTPWPYARYYSLGIDPAIQQGIHFSRPRP